MSGLSSNGGETADDDSCPVLSPGIITTIETADDDSCPVLSPGIIKNNRNS